jgi:hypothetical protein
VKLNVIILSIFFVLGFCIFMHESNNVSAVQNTASFDSSSKVRKPAFAYRAPAFAIEDEGAEEDEDDLYNNDACKAPENCLFNGKLQTPLGGKADRLNPIVMAFTGYSNSDEVEDLIHAARQQIAENPARYIVRKPNGRVQTYCYGAVKDALRAAGMLSEGYNCSGYARNGVVDLESPRAGFKNLLDFPKKTDPNYETKVAINSMLVNHPDMAPKGTILVYKTVPGAKRSNGRPVDLAGHTEIKIGDVGEDLYISVSEKAVPTYGYSLVTQRTLIGVMYLPRLLSPDSIYYQGQTPF